VFGGYKNVTFELSGESHPPGHFEKKEDILTYDIEKGPLAPGKMRTLRFNLLNDVSYLPKGRYSMMVFVRTSTSFGYDEKGHLIASSINYIESVSSNFEVPKDIETPNKIR